MSATAVAAPSGRLDPHERLEALCDPGSIRVLRSFVRSSRLGDRAVAGDGVVGATGTVDGRPIACYAQDAAFLGGSLGERHADTIVRVLELAASRADAGRRVRRIGRRADAGGDRGAGRLRADLPPDGRDDRVLSRRSRSSPELRRAAAPTRPRSPT